MGNREWKMGNREWGRLDAMRVWTQCELGRLKRIITHYPLPITHYPSPITHHPFPIPVKYEGLYL